MSGHDFEKQVRQKLNDLKITPSAGTWETIETRLRERKRRPVAFYWVPLLLIGLAAGGYLYLNNDQKTLLSDKKSTPDVKVQPKNADASRGNTVTIEEKPARQQAEINPSGSLPGDASQSNAVRPQEKSFVPRVTSQASKIIFPEEDQNLPEGSNKDDAASNSLKRIKEEKTAYGRNLSLKVSSYPIGSITPSPLNFKQTPGKSLAKKSNKWSYGFSAFAGISAVNEGHLLNFNNAQVEDVSRVPSFAPQPTYKPSSISPGLALSGGIFVKRELSKKFSLSLGLNYLQLNTRNKVGDRQIGNQIVNAGNTGYVMVSNFFRVEVDNNSDYHNRYHFVEMPVELHTKLNRSEKMPVQLTTGVAVSQLLKSTSLHFDGTTGVYYKDDRLLNKTQFAAKTGVSIGILNRSKRPLWIGPSAKYNISKVLKKDVAARTNFMSIGVDVKMFIK